MKKLITISLLSLLASCAFAEDDQGLFFGGGSAVTANNNCSQCDSSGYAIEAGYNFNKVFGVEAKFSNTEWEHNYYSDREYRLTYIGANIGHTFNSSWTRLYAKVGYTSVKNIRNDENESELDTSEAFGLGISLTPFAHQRGFYIKLESIRAEIFNDTISYGQLGAGFQF